MKINLKRDELMKKKGKLDLPSQLDTYAMSQITNVKVKTIILEAAINTVKESSNELSFSYQNIRKEEK